MAVLNLPGSVWVKEKKIQENLYHLVNMVFLLSKFCLLWGFFSPAIVLGRFYGGCKNMTQRAGILSRHLGGTLIKSDIFAKYMYLGLCLMKIVQDM